MQADENTYKGIELDESVPFEGNELDDSTSPSGSERVDDATEAADRPEDTVSTHPAEEETDSQVEQDIPAGAAAPGNRRKVLFTATAGLCTLALGAAMYATVFRPTKTVAPATAPLPAAMAVHPSLNLDNFLIPFHKENSHYISLSISLESAERAVMDELKKKKEILRGRIYDRLKAYAEGDGGHPTLATTKEMVSDSINAWLSAGRVDAVYITRFIIK